MNIFRNRLIQSGGSSSGTAVYIDGVRSTASRIDLDDIILMPYVIEVNSSYSRLNEYTSVVFNNEIHILGGYGHTTTHVKWNGTQWVNVSTLPFEAYGTAVVHQNKIHLFGGLDDSSPYSVISRINHWSWDGTSWVRENISGSAFPTDGFTAGLRIASLGDVIYIDQFKLENNNLSSFSNNFAQYVVYNNELHGLGTYSSSGNKKQHKKYNGSTWETVSTLPIDCDNNCVYVVVDGAIHIISGYDSHYIWDGDTWTQGDSALANHSFQGLVHNNKIALLGYQNCRFIEYLNLYKDVEVS